MFGHKKNKEPKIKLLKFEDMFVISNFFYKSIGVRPLIRKSSQSLWYEVVFWVTLINCVLGYIAEWIFLCASFGKPGSFLSLIALTPCICFVTLAIHAQLVVLVKRKKLRRIVNMLVEGFPTTLEGQLSQKVHEKKKQFEMYSYAYCGATIILIITFNFIPFVENLRDYLQKRHWEKILPYFMWYPFNEFDDQVFPYIYVHQTIAGFSASFALQAEIYLIGTAICQFCIHFEGLSREIRNYRPNKETDKIFLRKIIKKHNEILDHAQEFAEIVSAVLFIQQTCASIVICCVGFQVVVGKDIITTFKFVEFMLCVLVQTVAVSYYGNQILEHSSSIGTAVFESNWLEGDPQFRRAMTMIILRAKKPVYLTGFKVITVSLPGFMKILSTSYSYFALVRKMYYRL